MSHDCVYATQGWGVHDERWVAGLGEVGLTPQVISLGRDVHDIDTFRSNVEIAALGGLPVLAGPLNAITAHLTDLPITLVGLSWGYDLADPVEAAADLNWLTRLDGLIVDSRANATIAESAGMDPSRITLLPWGVDLSTFHFHDRSTITPVLDVPDIAPVVLSLRAHEPLYRVADIVTAFAQLVSHANPSEIRADPILLIGHTGSLTDQLREQARSLGIEDRVRFIGSVPEEDLIPLLHRADCYVTAARVDGTSVTLLQAMACGAPVVASGSSGNLGWIEDGVTGSTYRTGDVPALAEAIRRTLRAFPSEAARRARQLVEQQADWHANLARLRAAMVVA